jgi:hypothetical protein
LGFGLLFLQAIGEPTGSLVSSSMIWRPNERIGLLRVEESNSTQHFGRERRYSGSGGEEGFHLRTKTEEREKKKNQKEKIEHKTTSTI